MESPEENSARCADCQLILPEAAHAQGNAFHVVCSICCLHFCLECAQVSSINAYGMISTGQSWKCEPPCSPFKIPALKKRPSSPLSNRDAKRRTSSTGPADANPETSPGNASPQAVASIVYQAGTATAFRGVDVNGLFAQLSAKSPRGVLSISLIDQAAAVSVRLAADADSDTLLALEQLSGIGVTATLKQFAKRDVRVRCRVAGVDRSLCVDTLRTSLKSQGVVELARIMYWRGGVQYPTAKVIIEFSGEQAPDRISIGAKEHDVEILPKPLSCRRCLAFDHITTACPSSVPKCSLCGTLGHMRVNCDATTPTCANCSGNHRPWDGRCPVRRRAIAPALAAAQSSTSARDAYSASGASAPGIHSASSRYAATPSHRSYAHAVVGGSRVALASTASSPNSHPILSQNDLTIARSQQSLGADVAAMESSILASESFMGRITRIVEQTVASTLVNSNIVEQAVASSLAKTLEQTIEGVLVRVLTNHGLIHPQPPCASPVAPPNYNDSPLRFPTPPQPSPYPLQQTMLQWPVQQLQGFAQRPVTFPPQMCDVIQGVSIEADAMSQRILQQLTQQKSGGAPADAQQPS
jgi:hypothetical protein